MAGSDDRIFIRTLEPGPRRTGFGISEYLVYSDKIRKRRKRATRHWITKAMGSATGWDGWDTSYPIFLLFSTTPMGVAWTLAVHSSPTADVSRVATT